MSDTPLSSPERLVDGLVRLLSVEPGGADVCLGSPQKDGLGRVFGGQVLAQALQSAQASVTGSVSGSATGDATSDKAAHSLHAYFLRGGAEGKPIEYRIARDFDGNSFANRRVVASQQTEEGHWQPILNLTASFQRREDGLEHCEAPMPDIAPPEALKPDSEVRREVAERMSAHLSDNQRTLMLRPRPIEMRTVDRLHWMNTQPQPPRAHTWFRTIAPITGEADTPALHRALITYASDFTLLGTAALPHGLSWMRGELVGASLDHALWFHSEARADEWLLYATESPWSGGGRGFNKGRIFTRSGRLVASVAQEGVLRRRKPKPEPKPEPKPRP